jgi:D-glycero-D-manno-heptose 1,7-bisphosphate phosphatase
MNKAIFLDRDGVINRKGSSYYIFREEEFLLNKGVADSLKYFKSKGYLLIIITNQGGIARGIFTLSHLEKLHNYMIQQLKALNIELTDIFFCPHHPEISPCLCRKPGTLLFEQAVAKYDIDTKSSYMIGDSDIDIEAAEKMNIKGILIPTNSNIMNVIESGKITW